MKSYIYACLLAFIGPFLVTMTLGPIVIVDENEKRVSIIALMTEPLLLYCYLAAFISLAYALLIRAKKLKGRWWSNSILLLSVLIIFPALFLALNVNHFDLENPNLKGPELIGRHMFRIFSLCVVTFISGFLIKNKSESNKSGGDKPA